MCIFMHAHTGLSTGRKDAGFKRFTGTRVYALHVLLGLRAFRMLCVVYGLCALCALRTLFRFCTSWALQIWNGLCGVCTLNVCCVCDVCVCIYAT